MSEDGFKAHCAACAAIEWCKHAFGKYWADKSRGGIGCTYPLTAYLGTNRAEIPKPPPAPAAAPALKLVPESARREPWEGKTYTTHRREGGVFQSRKRKISARQGTLL